jgi:hypothetical protein
MEQSTDRIATDGTELRFEVDHWLMVADRPEGAICRQHGSDCPGSDEDHCNDCGRPIVWDEGRQDYRHAEEPERGCFLIAAEVVRQKFEA